MRIEVHHFHHGDNKCSTCTCVALLNQVEELKELIMATQAELTAQINALTEQVTKVQGEVTAAVATLQAAIEAAKNVDQGVLDAFDGLKAAVQGVDDLNPDAPAPAPEATPAE